MRKSRLRAFLFRAMIFFFIVLSVFNLNNRMIFHGTEFESSLSETVQHFMKVFEYLALIKKKRKNIL